MDRPDAKLNIQATAHDIRQMLMVITGRCGLLLKQGTDPQLRRHLLAMEMAATDAAAMLKRLSGAGGLDEARMSTGLAQVAEEVAGLILPPDGRDWSGPGTGEQEAGWVLERNIPSELHTTVPAQVLREVLSNLLVNALAVLPRGGTITLDACSCADEGRVLLRVEDTGPGVPAEIREQVFQPGFTSSGDSSRGLGLAGCRALLEDFACSLELVSDPGQGAVFQLDLPAAAAGSPEAGGAAPAEANSRLEPAEMLVVDDEPAVREMLFDLMNELGWQTAIAADAEQALAGFRKDRFPLALIDQTLPGMSGLELASRLREEDPQIVLVLVTGWGNEDIIARAPASGFDFTAEKPLTVDKIRGIIAKAAALLADRNPERE